MTKILLQKATKCPFVLLLLLTRIVVDLVNLVQNYENSMKMAPVTYTTEQKSFMFKEFIRTESYPAVRRSYGRRFHPNQRHPPLPDTKTIRNVIARHDATGRLDNLKPPGQPRTVRTEEHQEVRKVSYFEN